jgi:NTE family protein
MKALVISGGASKGAFAGGIAEFLIKDLGRHYDIYSGASTGSLLIPFLATGHIERIKDVYCTVTQSDIFSVCPFTIRKTQSGYQTGFNHLAILKQFFKGRRTLGESKSLRALIRKTLTQEIFESLRSQKAEVIATVSNLTDSLVEYKYARDCSYDEFCDWIWMSSNMIPFMSLGQKNGREYADGGFGNLIPVQEPINIGATELDVIILNPRHFNQPTPPSTNAFNLMIKGFNFMLHQIGQNDTTIAMLESRYAGVKINLIHTPRILTENSFVFDPIQMRAWWQEGYDYARYLYADTLDD